MQEALTLSHWRRLPPQSMYTERLVQPCAAMYCQTYALTDDEDPSFSNAITDSASGSGGNASVMAGRWGLCNVLPVGFYSESCLRLLSVQQNAKANGQRELHKIGAVIAARQERNLPTGERLVKLFRRLTKTSEDASQTKW